MRADPGGFTPLMVEVRRMDVAWRLEMHSTYGAIHELVRRGELTAAEAATALGISQATLYRRWSEAEAWLAEIADSRKSAAGRKVARREKVTR